MADVTDTSLPPTVSEEEMASYEAAMATLEDEADLYDQYAAYAAENLPPADFPEEAVIESYDESMAAYAQMVLETGGDNNNEPPAWPEVPDDVYVQTIQAMTDQERVEDYGLPADAIPNQVEGNLEPDTVAEPSISRAQQELEQAIDNSLAEMLAKPEQTQVKPQYNELSDADIRVLQAMEAEEELEQIELEREQEATEARPLDASEDLWIEEPYPEGHEFGEDAALNDDDIDEDDEADWDDFEEIDDELEPLYDSRWVATENVIPDWIRNSEIVNQYVDMSEYEHEEIIPNRTAIQSLIYLPEDTEEDREYKHEALQKWKDSLPLFEEGVRGDYIPSAEDQISRLIYIQCEYQFDLKAMCNGMLPAHVATLITNEDSEVSAQFLAHYNNLYWNPREPQIFVSPIDLKGQDGFCLQDHPFFQEIEEIENNTHPDIKDPNDMEQTYKIFKDLFDRYGIDPEGRHKMSVPERDLRIRAEISKRKWRNEQLELGVKGYRRRRYKHLYDRLTPFGFATHFVDQVREKREKLGDYDAKFERMTGFKKYRERFETGLARYLDLNPSFELMDDMWEYKYIPRHATILDRLQRSGKYEKEWAENPIQSYDVEEPEYVKKAKAEAKAAKEKAELDKKQKGKGPNAKSWSSEKNKNSKGQAQTHGAHKEKKVSPYRPATQQSTGVLAAIAGFASKIGAQRNQAKTTKATLTRGERGEPIVQTRPDRTKARHEFATASQARQDLETNSIEIIRNATALIKDEIRPIAQSKALSDEERREQLRIKIEGDLVPSAQLLKENLQDWTLDADSDEPLKALVKQALWFRQQYKALKAETKEDAQEDEKLQEAMAQLQIIIAELISKIIEMLRELFSPQRTVEKHGPENPGPSAPKND